MLNINKVLRVAEDTETSDICCTMRLVLAHKFSSISIEMSH